jgi:hypothetical protein
MPQPAVHTQPTSRLPSPAPVSTQPITSQSEREHKSQVYRWLDENDDFRDQYVCAREAQADKYFQEIIEIADAATPETVNVARLRVDSRKFTVARPAPKKYGDHIRHDVKGAGSSNFQPQILIQCSSAGDDEGYIDISAAPEAAGSLPQQGNGNSLPGSGGRR